MAATDAPQQAIGGTVTSYGGSIGYGGAWDVGAEHIPALVWPESVATYTRMRTDPVCASILAAYIGPLMAADWRINPSGADPEIVRICADSLGIPVAGEDVKDIGSARRRGVKWVEHCRLAALHLLWGHMCVDEETEALTQRGWVSGDELREGDQLLTINPETLLSEWHPCEKVHRYPGTHKVRRLEGRSHSSVTTLDHNWITKNHETGKVGFKKTYNLNTKDTFITAAPCATLPTEAKYEDAFVELVGWIYAEGNYAIGGKHFSLWQSERVNPDHVATIRRVMDNLLGKVSERMPQGSSPKYVESFRPGKGVWCWRMNHAASVPFIEVFSDPVKKIVSPEFIARLTEKQLHLFIESAMAGDGHTDKKGKRTYGQKYADRLDAMSMACALLGIPTTTYQMTDDFWTLSLRTRNVTRPLAAVSRSDNRRSVDVVEDYDGTVWCPSVPPNRTWLARRRGTVFYTGNCFEPVYEIRDGKAYLKALPERMPSTIVDIKINDDGTLKSIIQEGTGKGSTPAGVEIPADRLLWFCHNREGSNYLGTSLLRSCYSDWLLKLDSKRANAIGINRFGAGTPVAEPLPGTNPTTAQIAEAQRMVSAIRVGETGGAVPAGFKVRIIGVEGSLPDIVSTINLHNQEMARGSLTSVLDLGNTSNGSRALGDTFSDMLKGAIQAVGDAMAEVATQLCERLTTFNAGQGANSPQVSCGDVGASKAAIVTAITGLVAAGIVTPDEGLESYARDGYHLPPKDAVEAPAEPPADPSVDTTLAASGWQPWVMAAEGGADRNRGGAENFRRYWTEGPGAALIGYGTPGQFERCVAQLSKHMTAENAQGYCANRIKEVTGEWPGAHSHGVRAADSSTASGSGDLASILDASGSIAIPPALDALQGAGLQGVRSGEVMSVPAGVAKPGRVAAPDVLGERHRLQMGGVDARPDPTEMVQDQFLGDLAPMGLVDSSVRNGVLPVPVTIGEELADPNPARPEFGSVLRSGAVAVGSVVESGGDEGALERVAMGLKSPVVPFAHSSAEAAGRVPGVVNGASTVGHVGSPTVPAKLPAADTARERSLPSKFTACDVSNSPWRGSVAASAESPYREPTAQEQAAGIDPQQVDEAQDGLVAEGMALFAAIVAVWGAAIAAQITASLAAGSLAGLARLTVDSTDAAQGLAVLMREAADAGVSHAFDEARRAGIPAPSVAPEVDGAALDDAAAAAADLMGQGLASAAGREAARIFGPDSDPKTVARQAVATVTESDTPIHDAIQAGVTRAMGAGRAAAQAALMVGADLTVFASALLDRATCGPCLTNDGREYPDLAAGLADFPSGHYSACLGRGRCRCLLAVRPVTT